jgi:dTDP-4-amino-4,6-dideoxy-D-galactose acyltransferase
MTDPCQLLPWDTQFFGMRIARASRSILDKAYLGEALDWCQKQAIDCLYFLAEADHAQTARLAEQYNFRFVDVRLTLEREIKTGAVTRQDPARINVRAFQPGDEPALSAIASTSYTPSRFYFDDCFPRQACARLYQTWIEKSCQGYADQVLVAQIDGEPAGYLTCHLQMDTLGGEIGLVGIADKERGSGAGKDLLAAAVDWFSDQGCTSVRVVTQGRNVAAQRLYQRCGFLTKSVQLWYHKWFVDCARFNRADER